MKNCPQCDCGFTFGEHGEAYTCYVCCETGYVSDETYAAYMDGVNEDPEYHRYSAIERMQFDEWVGEVFPVRRKILPWEIQQIIRCEKATRERNTMCFDDCFDDIPF